MYGYYVPRGYGRLLNTAVEVQTKLMPSYMVHLTLRWFIDCNVDLQLNGFHQCKKIIKTHDSVPGGPKSRRATPWVY